ncbi:transcription termination factor NusA [Parasphaerochaeta coccoides]|uniref:Transcription termination/antitermination protein NusA n=1 Tax=Parasphaerochaeta coccoides (strain ATCC BAA-1237 / DSM 17374 / SPN1) TaxID=760011 RepID=F4GK49_PARC1|nr:transcription termination factor NusA [Parasphaerochaeta coccoides]AEC01821.1 NusA antitermination factor [Parasphaerochaeta coccoides DSM 17374]
MSTNLSEAIKSMVEEKGISQDLVISTIEDFLRAAYKRKFGTDANAVVQFSDDLSNVTLNARRIIVEDENYYDMTTEISLEEAEELVGKCEIGDELLVPIDLKEFDRISIQSAKQRSRQSLRDIQKDTTFKEYENKTGQLIIGYVQRQIGDDFYVDIGSTEGILPRRNQSSREVYRQGDKVKFYVEKVEKTDHGVRVVLSRTSAELVKLLFELEVPEIYDHSIEIHDIVREAGYRTKVAVYSHRDDIDPVGACVGLKGMRIQTIMKEIEGEKIDILKYDPNPEVFIRNALAPAEVKDVILLKQNERRALAIVDDTQLSLAIGKQGLNVRLANQLSDWIIEVKTEAQFAELDIASTARSRAEALFTDADEVEDVSDYEMTEDVPALRFDEGEVADEDYVTEEEDGDEGDLNLSELPIDAELIAKLNSHGIYTVGQYINLDDAELTSLDDVTVEEKQKLDEIFNEFVSIEEEHIYEDDDK